MKKYERRLTVDGRKFRFTNFVDEESFAFEQFASVSGTENLLADAAIEQTLNFIQHTKRNYYLMQMKDKRGQPAMQACVYIGRPKFLSFFAMASIPGMATTKSPIEEEIGMRVLQQLCKKIPGVMTLRLQPQRYEQQQLMNFQSRALRAGFSLADAIGTVRTLVIPLEESPEVMIGKLPPKTRAKFRHQGKNRVEIRLLKDHAFLPKCQEAANISMRKTGSQKSNFDFETAFAMARETPDRARILGLFLNSKPDNLLAYVIGYRNGSRCEFVSAGAMLDPELRSMPFNCFLIWELFNWAREQGATSMDLGGVTDGGPTDPLQGITRFKRSIASLEIEKGREMISVLKPIRFLIYQSLKNLRTPKKPAHEELALENLSDSVGLQAAL